MAEWGESMGVVEDVIHPRNACIELSYSQNAVLLTQVQRVIPGSEV